MVLQPSEIVERHPALKLVFTEQGVEWVIGAAIGTDLTIESWLIAMVEKGSRLSCGSRTGTSFVLSGPSTPTPWMDGRTFTALHETVEWLLCR